MNIGVDQGNPRGDLARYQDGKYIYVLPNGKFDIDKFNRDFDQYKDERKKEMAETLKTKLAILNKPKVIIPAYDLSIGQIVINTKDAIFNLLDDILNFNYTSNILLKQNRMFYLGLALIFIAFLIYFYMFFIQGEKECDVKIDVQPKVDKVVHIHEIKLFNENIQQTFQQTQKGA